MGGGAASGSSARAPSPRRARCWCSSSATTRRRSRARSTSSRRGRQASRSASARSSALPSRSPRRRRSRSPTRGGGETRPRCSRRARRSSSASRSRGATRRRGSRRRSAHTSPVSAPASGSPAEGVRPRDAAGRLKMHPFYAEKLFAQADRFSAEELGDALVRLAALDLALKGESRLASDLELQRALVDVAREPARRLGARARSEPRGARAFLRAAVFLCSAPRDAALSIVRTSSRCSGRDRVRVAVGDGRLEPLRQRLDARAVAQVLQPLAGGGATRFSCWRMFGISVEMPALGGRRGC